MIYNNLYPFNYQSNQSQNNTRIYVTGEAGAKSYLIAPNTSVVLWDSEGDTFYIKSADQSGMPTLRVFDFKERGVKETPTVEYATQEDLNALKKEIEKLKGAKK